MLLPVDLRSVEKGRNSQIQVHCITPRKQMSILYMQQNSSHPVHIILCKLTVVFPRHTKSAFSMAQVRCTRTALFRICKFRIMSVGFCIESFMLFCNFFQIFPIPVAPEATIRGKRCPAEFLHQFSTSEYGFFVKNRETAKFDISGVDKPAVWG